MRLMAFSRRTVSSVLALGLALPVAAGTTVAQAQAPTAAGCMTQSPASNDPACLPLRLSAAEGSLAAAYDRLAGTLDAPARAHLAADQASWRAAHDRICSTPTLDDVTAGDPPDRQACILARTEWRTERLRVMPAGADYPYISDHARVESGSIPGITYGYMARYPRFDRPGIDYGRVNGEIATAANRIFDKPDPSDAIEGQTQTWSQELDYTLVFPVRGLVCIVESWGAYLGGAHPNSGVGARLVHLPSGRALAVKDLLVAGYAAKILPMVQQDLRRQFRDNPGFDEALEPAALGKLLEEDRRWIVRQDAIEIVFNPYEVGSYAAGPYAVSLPYRQIASLIRRDGPLAGVVH